MKIIKSLYFILLVLIFISGCKTSMTFEAFSSPPCAILDDYTRIYINGPYLNYDSTCSYVYQWALLEKYNKENFYTSPRIFCSRSGGLADGKQNGLWKSENDNQIIREEYFKMGLRDSIYRIYNAAGDTIYSTYFKLGTGIEKDNHRNGQLYYEIALKDGYFTDTLRIYDEQGRVSEKLYFDKDSLTYYKSFSYPEE